MPEQKKDPSAEIMSDKMTIDFLNAQIKDLKDENAALLKRIEESEKPDQSRIFSELRQIQDQLLNARDLRLDSQQTDDLRSRQDHLLKSLGEWDVGDSHYDR